MPLDDLTLTREQRRSRRAREVRAVTESMKRLSKAKLREGAELYPEETASARPRTRGDCKFAMRPCPFVSCSHHLALDVSAQTGAIKYNFPDLEPDDMLETCALDIADRGGASLEAVGRVLNLTRERVRQIEVKALRKLFGRDVDVDCQGVPCMRELVEHEVRVPVRAIAPVIPIDARRHRLVVVPAESEIGLAIADDVELAADDESDGGAA